jgi:hypothetical protein
LIIIASILYVQRCWTVNSFMTAKADACIEWLCALTREIFYLNVVSVSHFRILLGQVAFEISDIILVGLIPRLLYGFKGTSDEILTGLLVWVARL